MTAMALTLTGQLAAESAIPWFLHRGRLLDLTGWISRVDAHTITMVLWGHPDLLDAMEVASSLGPVNVLVEDLVRDHHDVGSAPTTLDVREISLIA